MDVDQKKIWKLREQGFNVGTEYLDCDVQIICVYTMDQVLNVLRQIPQHPNTLISVESTIDPRRIGELHAKVDSAKLVLFPHRYNPNDLQHRVFNLDRVMGARSDIGWEMAIDFYSNFMDTDLIHRVDFEIAGLAKVAENAYRFIEIAMSEYLHLLCDDASVDYGKLRAAMNTKWNIDVKETRDGIGGHCLPKDMDIFRHFMKSDPLRGNILNLLFWKDTDYKRKYGNHRRP